MIIYLYHQLDMDKMYSCHPNHRTSLDVYAWDILTKGQRAQSLWQLHYGLET